MVPSRHNGGGALRLSLSTPTRIFSNSSSSKQGDVSWSTMNGIRSPRLSGVGMTDESVSEVCEFDGDTMYGVLGASFSLLSRQVSVCASRRQAERSGGQVYTLSLALSLDCGEHEASAMLRVISASNSASSCSVIVAFFQGLRIRLSKENGGALTASTYVRAAGEEGRNGWRNAFEA